MHGAPLFQEVAVMLRGFVLETERKQLRTMTKQLRTMTKNDGISIFIYKADHVIATSLF